MTLTKADIINILREQIGLPKKDCLKIVNGYFEEISKGLEKGEEIKIPKLGNFVVKHKNSRPGRNPKTGQEHKIEARKTVKFYPSLEIKKKVKKTITFPRLYIFQFQSIEISLQIRGAT